MSKQMSAEERMRKASRVEQANGLAVRANEQMDERVAQYFKRQLLNPLAHRVMQRPNQVVLEISSSALMAFNLLTTTLCS